MNVRPLRYLSGAMLALISAGVWLTMALPILGAPGVGAPAASTFTVTSTADVADAAPGDGVCDTGGGVCTLRAAIQEANVYPGADTIKIPAGFYQLTQLAHDGTITGGLIITASVTILGAGPNSTIIDGNSTALHARVFNITGTVTISGVAIQNGFSPNLAGGVLNNGPLTIINSAILSNTANGINDWGGGIATFGNLTVTNSLIRGNTTGSQNAYGGGIMNGGLGAVVVIDSTISGNRTYASTNPYSPGYGGGLYGAHLTVINSTISGNTAAAGGGIYTQGALIINSTISGNDSNGDGGGLYAAAGTTSLFNGTVADNLANADDTGSAIGGGVYNQSGSTFNFRNSLIALNGKVVVPGPFLFDSDCGGTLTSQGHNIMYDPSDCTVNGSIITANPGLGLLSDNGGRTQTQALQPWSPAINAGEAPYCTDQLGAPIPIDQRGVSRPANGCDIGAYEYQWTVYLPFIRK